MKFNLLFVILFYHFNLQAQLIESDFEGMRRDVASIGIVVLDSSKDSNGKLVQVKKFKSLGSGLTTYVRYDTLTIYCIVTAAHVLKIFEEQKIDSFYIRYSWADSIKTTDYFGVSVPKFMDKTLKTFFYHPDNNIDIGCILLPYDFINKDRTLLKYINGGNKIHQFPYNSMANPKVGDQIWIYGYPSHIVNIFQNEFNYNISTFKSGIVTWRNKNSDNTILNKIILAESNASFGNSGGPVFSILDNINLVGILIGGYGEPNPLRLGNIEIKDSVSKNPYFVETRSGVSVIVKAEYVRELLNFVENTIKPQK